MKQKNMKARPKLSIPFASFDARVWASSFVRHVRANPKIATDVGTMTSWFASAIMRGYDEHAHRRKRKAT